MKGCASISKIQTALYLYSGLVLSGAVRKMFVLIGKPSGLITKSMHVNKVSKLSYMKSDQRSCFVVSDMSKDSLVSSTPLAHIPRIAHERRNASCKITARRAP